MRSLQPPHPRNDSGNPARIPPDRWLAPISGCLFGFALLLLIHRYVGINHDSILYLGQGLMRRWPQIFGQDLFFIHGSQDRYSIFPWLIAQLLPWINPPILFLWGSAIGLIAFFAASWHCLRILISPGTRYFAWLATICLPAVYGMIHLFSYGEKFLTPRPFSEALCLLAVALLSRQRMVLAFTCLIVAATLHPLQTFSASLILWPWLVMRNHRWLHAAWLVLPVLLMAAIGVDPFSNLFLRIDPDWLYNLHDGTPQLFLSKWDVHDAKNILFDACVLAYAWRALERNFARWCASAIIGLSLGVVSTAALVDGLHLALPAALQPWRVHWLAHWLSIAAIGCFLYRDIHEKDVARISLLSLSATLAWGDGTWEWLPLIFLYIGWPSLRKRLPSLASKTCSFLFTAILVLMLIEHMVLQLQGFSDSGYQLDLFPVDRLLLAFPVLGFGIPLLLTIAWLQCGKLGQRLILSTLLLPLAALSCYAWDSRGVANRIFEANIFNPSIFGTSIPEHAQVFWYPGSIMGPWLVLKRANYFSPGQVAGEIFNRQTAIDARRRIEKLRPLIEQGLGCDQSRNAGTYHRECIISARNLHRACEPGKIPAPDFLVLPYLQPQAIAGVWTLIDPAGLQPNSMLWLYRCRDILTPRKAK